MKLHSWKLRMKTVHWIGTILSTVNSICVMKNRWKKKSYRPIYFYTSLKNDTKRKWYGETRYSQISILWKFNPQKKMKKTNEKILTLKIIIEGGVKKLLPLNIPILAHQILRYHNYFWKYVNAIILWKIPIIKIFEKYNSKISPTVFSNLT